MVGVNLAQNSLAGGTTPADLLALCGALDDITADNAVCVVAGQSRMDGCDYRLITRRTV